MVCLALEPIGRGCAAPPGLLAVGVLNVLAFDVRAFPNQSVYFNELVGGPRGAEAKFEMDYWGNCILEGVDWSAKAARASGRALTISGNIEGLVQLDSERYHELSYQPPQRPHNLDVLLNRGDAESIVAMANRTDALYRVRTPDGAVLCVVVPGTRPDRWTSRQHTAIISA